MYNVLLLQLIQKTIDIFFIVWQLLGARLVRPDRQPGPVLTFLVCGQPELQRAVSSLGPSETEEWDVPACPASVWYPGRQNYELWEPDESTRDQRAVTVRRARLLAVSVKDSNNVGSLPNGQNNKCLDDHISALLFCIANFTVLWSLLRNSLTALSVVMTSKPRDSELPPLALISLLFVIIYISARAGWETKNVKCYFCIFL